ncbi:hypothetical protein C8F01DRAFT_1230894 [Mycena amicta]|nr:hypothetical protein C8F01DRAFT_1230894 [Mycena amicta]
MIPEQRVAFISSCPPQDDAGNELLQSTFDSPTTHRTCTYAGTGNTCTYFGGQYVSGPSPCPGAPPGIAAILTSVLGNLTDSPETSSPHSGPPGSTVSSLSTGTSSSVSFPSSTSKSATVVTTASPSPTGSAVVTIDSLRPTGSAAIIQSFSSSTPALPTGFNAPSIQSQSLTKNPTSMVIGISVGVSVAGILLLALCYWRWRRRNSLAQRNNSAAEEEAATGTGFYTSRISSSSSPLSVTPFALPDSGSRWSKPTPMWASLPSAVINMRELPPPYTEENNAPGQS